jgi:RHH-type proline utilization regulon transcriptional repressor/proline dehydrogenase/delta 1-pyrroline-5-carboxylate dehydrogenase
VEHDPSAVRGERNVFRYIPCEPLLLRAGGDADPLDLLLACTAALTSGSGFELSLEPELAAAMPYHEGLPGVTSVVESPADCARRVDNFERARTLGTPEDPVLRAADEASVHVCTDAPLLAGRVELLRYVHEQSLSHRYHRHGNLAAARLLPELRD